MTPFQKVYDKFFGLITDDMYLEWTKEDTLKDCKNILIDAIPGFEFPRKTLQYTDDNFVEDLTDEEITILGIIMMNIWLQRQITSVENIRMKYTGSDFKMTSQANHLSKLLILKADTEKQDRHMQRLYKRRIQSPDGVFRSNWSHLFSKRAINYDD